MAKAPTESTRTRLLRAALKILQTEGWAGLSTVRLAAEVGIVQSGFYRHFPSIEACVSEAIAPISEHVRGDVAARRRAWFAKNPGEPAAAVEHYRQNLRIVAELPVLADIALRRRFESSPVGRAMAAFGEGLVHDMVEDLVVGRSARGLGTDPKRAQVAARIIMAAVYGAMEVLLAGDEAIEQTSEALAMVGQVLGDGAWLEPRPAAPRSAGARGAKKNANPAERSRASSTRAAKAPLKTKRGRRGR